MKRGNPRIGLLFPLVYGEIFLLFVTIGVYSVITIGGLAAIAKKMYDHPFIVTGEILKTDGNVHRIHRFMKDIAMARDDTAIGQMAAKIDLLDREVNRNLATVRERFLGDTSRVDKLIRDFGGWKPIRDEAIARKRADKSGEPFEIGLTHGAEAVDAIAAEISGIKDYAAGVATGLSVNATASGERAIWIINTLYILGCAMTAVAAFLSIRRQART